MSFTDFSEDQFIKTVDTGEKIKMGSFQTPENGELVYMRITPYWEGKIPTTEQVRLNIYSNPEYTALLYQSDYSDLVDISNKSTNWIGWLRIDFNREPVNLNSTYYVEAEYNNYTRTGSYFQSLCWDFPFPIYGSSNSLFFDNPLQMQIIYAVDRSN